MLKVGLKKKRTKLSKTLTISEARIEFCSELLNERGLIGGPRKDEKKCRRTTTNFFKR